MTKDELLAVLPPFTNERVLINPRQSVADIMRETLNAHDAFAGDYDLIASRFVRSSRVETLRGLFNFLKNEVDYVEETERMQMTKSPAAILETGRCDCKCYALFIGGVLDALNRKGGNYDWNYVYASYTAGVRTPGHVFVQCRTNGREYWVDPVLSEFDQRKPVPRYMIRKQKDNTDMALYRLSGTGSVGEVATTTQHTNQTGLQINVVEWVKKNPVLAVGIVATAVYLFSKSKKRRR